MVKYSASMKRENILVVKHGALGDFVLSLSLMSAIVKRHPGARFTLITQSFLVDLAKRTGFFDEIIVDNRGYKIRDWWRIIKKTLADRPFDRIYDLQSNNRTLVRYAPLARFATRHPMRWGKRVKDGFDFLCTPAKLPFTFKRCTVEHVDMDAPRIDISFIHGEGRNFHLLPAKYALVIPGCSAGSPQKRWPPERYREISLWLGSIGIKSVVLGTKAESAEIDAVCRDNPHAVNFMGKSAISDLPDIASRAIVAVGNDTGPSHIAWRSGAQTVMCFTEYDSRALPRVPNVTGLVAQKITDIPVEDVKRAVEARLGKVT